METRVNKFKNIQKKVFSKFDLEKKINTLENENETLKEVIKSELYKEFMSKLGEPLQMERLKEENKKLRKKVKLLKEILRGDKNV